MEEFLGQGYQNIFLPYKTQCCNFKKRPTYIGWSFFNFYLFEEVIYHPHPQLHR